jgi:hypothetical protein
MDNLLLYVTGTNLSLIGPILIAEKGFQKMSPQRLRVTSPIRKLGFGIPFQLHTLPSISHMIGQLRGEYCSPCNQDKNKPDQSTRSWQKGIVKAKRNVTGGARIHLFPQGNLPVSVPVSCFGQEQCLVNIASPADTRMGLEGTRT